jgi:hypothetical protein
MRRPVLPRHLAAFALLAALAAPAWAGKPAPLAVAPSTATVASGGHVAFKASGGEGGYEYAVTANASGATIDPATGDYTAGAAAGTDTVTVTDDAGKTATAQVKVQASASSTPAAPGDELGGHR